MVTVVLTNEHENRTGLFQVDICAISEEIFSKLIFMKLGQTSDYNNLDL